MEHSVFEAIRTELEQRVLVLDGAMGTMIQRLGLGESDYRTERFATWPCALSGCHDVLSLTRPDVIRRIHRLYLEAGADIITTNSFNTNAVSLREYGLDDIVYELSRQSAHLAREEADTFMLTPVAKPRFVAGSVGPGNKSLSLSSDITFEQLTNAYIPQIEGLLDGGCDIILVETVFDLLNAKAATYAIETVFERRQRRWPLMISATLSAHDGRLPSGHTLDEFVNSVSQAMPLALGLNCSLGPKSLLPYIGHLSGLTQAFVSCHPNAGLPNAQGEYTESPETFAATIAKMMQAGHVNIVGGCCGTTPAHIRALHAAATSNEK